MIRRIIEAFSKPLLERTMVDEYIIMAVVATGILIATAIVIGAIILFDTIKLKIKNKKENE